MTRTATIGILLSALVCASPALAQDDWQPPAVGGAILPFYAYVGLPPFIPPGIPVPPSLARTVSIGDAQCIENEFGTAREFGGATVLVSTAPGGPIIATLPIFAGGLAWCAQASVPGAPPGTYWVLLVFGITSTTSAPAEYWQQIVVPGEGGGGGGGCMAAPFPPVFPRSASGSPLTGNWGINVDGNTVSLAFAGSPEGCAFQSIQLEAGTSPGASDVATAPLNGLSATFLDVPNGSYYVRARGVNAFGVGPASEEIPIRIPRCVATGFPYIASQPTASLNGNQLTISYAPLTGTIQVPPTFHQVLVLRPNGTLVQTVLGPGTNPFTVTMPPVPSGTYRLVVRTGTPCGGYDHLGADQEFGTGLTIVVP